MRRVTATIITRDEASNIAGAIASVSFCDEVLVVDSGSSDDTVAIAKSDGARVMFNEWPGHVAQKNFAIDNASHDWILSIDADERISGELAASIKSTLASDDGAAGYEMSRRAFYLGRWIRHCGWYPDRRIRLFHRRSGRWEGIDPHDIVKVGGEVRRLRGDILHYTYRDVAHHLSVIDRYTTISAGRMFDAGKRAGVLDLVARPAWAFVKKFILKAGFLDGLAGLVVCSLASYYVFLKYAKLWELGRGS